MDAAAAGYRLRAPVAARRRLGDRVPLRLERELDRDAAVRVVRVAALVPVRGCAERFAVARLLPDRAPERAPERTPERARAARARVAVLARELRFDAVRLGAVRALDELRRADCAFLMFLRAAARCLLLAIVASIRIVEAGAPPAWSVVPPRHGCIGTGSRMEDVRARSMPPLAAR